MEDLVDAGKIKSIGLSNFNSEQIQEVIDNSRIKPVNHQVLQKATCIPVSISGSATQTISNILL